MTIRVPSFTTTPWSPLHNILIEPVRKINGDIHSQVLLFMRLVFADVWKAFFYIASLWYSSIQNNYLRPFSLLNLEFAPFFDVLASLSKCICIYNNLLFISNLLVWKEKENNFNGGVKLVW